jgi:hypothetical protein
MNLMTKINNTILEKIRELESSLQDLKLAYFFNLPKKQRNKFQIYNEKEILIELKKARKKIWNEKYTKEIQSFS